MERALEEADSSSETDLKVMKLARKNGAIAAYYVGTKARRADDFETARDIYKKGIEYQPSFYANYIGYAQALEGLGMQPQAVVAYLEAGEVCEKSKKADKAEKMNSKAENMVAVAWGDKDWGLVVDMANAYLENSESADVHYYLSDALVNEGKTDEALAHIDQSIEIAADGSDKYLMQKAELLEAKGDKTAAVEVYKQITDSKYVERAKYKINEIGG